MRDQNLNLRTIANLRQPSFILMILFCLCGKILNAQQTTFQEANQMGAVIVVSVEGKANLIVGEDDAEAVELKTGAVLAEGDFIKVDSASSVVLLFSNGTLVTAQENTEMTIGVFEQEPFEATTGSVENLDSEPSSSKVEIDLDFGSLVVKTKKLDKKSSFDINSPLGTAGIRGTEFQLGVDPSKGMQLDVTESTVAFTPPGGSPVPISQGQGLDVSRAGAMSTRPVAPVVAQKITVTNNSATKASGKSKIGKRFQSNERKYGEGEKEKRSTEEFKQVQKARAGNQGSRNRRSSPGKRG